MDSESNIQAFDQVWLHYVYESMVIHFQTWLIGSYLFSLTQVNFQVIEDCFTKKVQ